MRLPTGAPLKGISVGNGCTGTEIGVCGGQRDQYETEYLIDTPLVAPDLKQQIRATCNFSSTPSAECYKLIAIMHDQIGCVQDDTERAK